MDWMHAAPHCRTFSRRRRADGFGQVKQLRSKERPEGFGDPDAEQANLIAKRLAALCGKLQSRGRFWSIENPADSFLWELKEFVKLAKLEGVMWVYLDQCAYGAPSPKPTYVLTNAPWLVDTGRLCRDAPPHSHAVLEGRALDYRVDPPVRVWRTALGAEYPVALCSA